jgi:hypothetical protein
LSMAGRRLSERWCLCHTFWMNIHCLAGVS